MEGSEEKTRKNATKMAKGATFEVDLPIEKEEEELRAISIAIAVEGPRSGAERRPQRPPTLEPYRILRSHRRQKSGQGGA